MPDTRSGRPRDRSGEAEAGGFADRAADYRQRLDEELESWLSRRPAASQTLQDAMRYALLGGGKRIRPLLAYASGELLAVAPQRIDPIAAAIEMIHAYSLVHDDLPAMDDDELRRGRPTVHVAYGEANAILVGDALQALAFQVLSEHEALAADPAASVAMVRRLAAAAGADGMVGGQALDLTISGVDVRPPDLEDMFARKTGRLIAVAITMPLDCSSDVAPAVRQELLQIAEVAGLCFQIRDDVLDVTGDTDRIGKPAGSDERNNRLSYPLRFGLEAANRRVEELLEEAMGCVDRLGSGADGLRWIINFIVGRDH